MDVFDLTARRLRELISKKELGVCELLNLYLDRIERYDGEKGLNTVSELDPDAGKVAKSMDRGEINKDLPLFGLPILVKDNIDVRGLHTTAGSAALRDNIAACDADIIKNLRKNGAIILGKTKMTEFANHIGNQTPVGYSSLGGQVLNAYDRAISPGGSSSGSAVAVSAGLCAAAIGTDTAFSIIGCATENGVVGLKPPAGELSSAGIVPISETLDSAGPLTRDFRDALLITDGMRDKPGKEIRPADPSSLKIAINVYDRGVVSKAQLGRYETVFERLRAVGASFTEIIQNDSPALGELTNLEFKYCLEKYLATSTVKYKTLDSLVRFYKSQPEYMKYGIEKLEASLSSPGTAPEGAEYKAALAKRSELRRKVTAELCNYDICVMTGPVNIMHLTGLPSAALQMCMAEDNTPRGMIVYGANAERFYSAVLAIEKFCDGVTLPRL